MVDHGLLRDPARSVIRRFARSRPKVDLPEDLGPQRKTFGMEDDWDLRLAVTREASFLFHSGGETSSWSVNFLGTSKEEKI